MTPSPSMHWCLSSQRTMNPLGDFNLDNKSQDFDPLAVKYRVLLDASGRVENALCFTTSAKLLSSAITEKSMNALTG